jgi:thrombospondin type 3 repeat protein
MKTKQLLMAVAVSAIALAAPPAHAIGFRSLVVVDPTGSVRIQQALPCGDDLDLTRPIAGGRIELALTSLRIQPTFNLAKMDLFLEPFSVRRQCRGVDATAEFYEIGVRLAGAVSFGGVPTGGPESNQFAFRIPKEQFLIYETVLDNAPVPQPERMYVKPSEDVTGLIDLRARTIDIHIALASRMRFRAGCIGARCAIDEEKAGTQRADVAGAILAPNADGDEDGVPDVIDTCPGTANPSQGPDTTAPTVSCEAVPSLGRSFRVSAADSCSRRVSLRLGPFMLGNGEVIQIQETGQAGVRLLREDGNGLRHFQVGKGEAIVTATDAANNVDTALCGAR